MPGKPGSDGALPRIDRLLPLAILLSSRMWQALTGMIVCAPPRTLAKPPPLVTFFAATLFVQSLDDELEWLDSCDFWWWPSWPQSVANAEPAVEARPAPMMAVVRTVLRSVDTLSPHGRRSHDLHGS